MSKLAATAVVSAALVLWTAAAGLADDSILNTHIDPPEPIKGEDSRIRMVSERLDLYFGFYETRVEVVFELENLTDQPVILTVGFPDSYLQAKYVAEGGNDLSERYGYIDEKFDYYSPLEDFVTWVDEPSNVIQTEVYKLERYYSLTEDPQPGFASEWKYARHYSSVDEDSLKLWHAFKLDWEPRQARVVGHSYRTDHGSVNVGFGQAWLNYYLGTGSTWDGPIGRLEVNLYLTDGQVVEDLALGEESAGVGSWPQNAETQKWAVLSPTHLRLVWKDFEPVDERSYIEIMRKPEATLLRMGRKYEFLPTLEELLGHFTWEELDEYGFLDAQGWEKPSDGGDGD
jgi:hypothetical protein